MRAHMLSLLSETPAAGHVARHGGFDLPSHYERADELASREAIEPAVVEHVNRHFQADPACETTVIKRMSLKTNGAVMVFEAIAHFHGHRLQGDVAVTGTYDPATPQVVCKRLKELTLVRRGSTRRASWMQSAKRLLRETSLFLNP